MIDHQDLMELGMSEKEARIYLTSVYLGPASAQRLSREARVNRATCYAVIESLIQKNMLSTSKVGKRTMYSAEPPTNLKNIFLKNLKELQARRTQFLNVLPELERLFERGVAKPLAQVYEGNEGMQMMKDYFLSSRAKMAKGLVSFEDLLLLDPDESFFRARLEVGIPLKLIYTTPSGPQAYLHDPYPDTEIRFMESDGPLFGSGIFIFNDILAQFRFKGKFQGIFIRSHEMCQTMDAIHYTIWNTLPPSPF